MERTITLTIAKFNFEGVYVNGLGVLDLPGIFIVVAGNPFKDWKGLEVRCASKLRQEIDHYLEHNDWEKKGILELKFLILYTPEIFHKKIAKEVEQTLPRLRQKEQESKS